MHDERVITMKQHLDSMIDLWKGIADLHKNEIKDYERSQENDDNVESLLLALDVCKAMYKYRESLKGTK